MKEGMTLNCVSTLVSVSSSLLQVRIHQQHLNHSFVTPGKNVYHQLFQREKTKFSPSCRLYAIFFKICLVVYFETVMENGVNKNWKKVEDIMFLPICNNNFHQLGSSGPGGCSSCDVHACFIYLPLPMSFISRPLIREGW